MSLELLKLLNLPLYLSLASISGIFLYYILVHETPHWNSLEASDKKIENSILGIILGFCFLGGIVYPFVWFTGFGMSLSREYALNISGFIELFFLLGTIVSAHYLFKISSKLIVEMLSKLTLVFSFVLIALPYFAIALHLGLNIYPHYLQSILKPSSQFLIWLTLPSILFVLANVVNSIILNQIQIRDEDEIPTVDLRMGMTKEKTWRGKILRFKSSLRRMITKLRTQKFTRKKKIIALGFVLFIFSPLIIIPIDLNIHFVTPKLQIFNEESYSSSWGPELVMNISQDVKSDNFLLQYYELRFKRYDVVLSDFPYAMKSIFVENPSNCSKLGNLGLPKPYVNSLWEIENLWVTYDEDISITFLSDDKDVKEMIIDFSNVSSRLVNFNVTYFQQFNSRNVTFDCDIEYGEWQNNTKLDTYEFYISNNENATLEIPQIEINILSIADCDHENVEVYLNGNQISRSVNDEKIYSIDIEIQPYSDGNITVIIPRQMNES